MSATVASIPKSWHDILDVGCGDGRLSRQLIASGRNCVGVDWSSESLKHYPSSKVVHDIRNPFNFDKKFDGAICCEVLEHLRECEISQVIANICSVTANGFLISVPAREPLESQMVKCAKCNRHYHVWGHCRKYTSFNDVDCVVGHKSCKRVFIESQGFRNSESLAKIQNRLGFGPYSSSYTCQYCGAQQVRQGSPTRLNLFLSRLIEVLQRGGSMFRRPQGWFVCLYLPKSLSENS